MTPTIWHSGKGKILERIKRLVLARVSKEEGQGGIDGTQGIYKTMKLFFMIL